MLIVNKKYGSFKSFDGAAGFSKSFEGAAGFSKSFDGAKAANKCLPYDHVSLNNSGCTLIKRTTHPVLVGILETTGPKYGLTSHNHPIYLCKPLDQSYPSFYIGSKIIDPVYNKLITFQFESWTQQTEFPKGTFIELLGNCGNYDAEKRACLLLASPYKWKKLIPTIVEPSKQSRLYIDGYTFNVDPDACKDIDDCITIQDNKLIISISDVSAYVEVNPWMKFAEYIGTSLYNSGTCVKPMFPPVLSENMLSLIEGQERLAYSLIITFNTTISYEFKETVVKVDKSYTYDSFYKSNHLETLKKYVWLLSGIDTADTHKMIEILMLYYNTKAGEVLKEKNMGILRKQNGTKTEKANLFEEFSNEYMFLAYESASYCLPCGDTSHAFLNAHAYAHTSSPIRRYVDIINQFALKSKVFEYECIERFNNIQKKAKQFERDLIFLELYFHTKHIIEAVVLSDIYIFIPALKKIVEIKNRFDKNERIELKYYSNPQKQLWKERIIFSINLNI